MNENQNELKGISLYHSNTNMNTIQLVEKIHKRQGLYVASLKKSEFFEMFPFDDREEHCAFHTMARSAKALLRIKMR